MYFGARGFWPKRKIVQTDGLQGGQRVLEVMLGDYSMGEMGAVGPQRFYRETQVKGGEMHYGKYEFKDCEV
ncbi:hypothetical protein MGG_16005 [Pyricularia oryzae 70-15]|uniref:Uncharacterized protein n=3 Tax=Pyricularia oryzae TaxID=318829 RepID=G4MMT3_PYRO7|nr:uncharacterized protein MGG_16005 [Pyricularia oryzae 70-15]EHA56163.1 hypothetical protein MGG_16005 [Pyricularia oryzae 70-15]ELQ35959.1 hypothetical protein OOU_Y34scaffold00676g4 [Pyricularia oryzae Y34]